MFASLDGGHLLKEPLEKYVTIFFSKGLIKGENETVKNEIRNESREIFREILGLPFTNEKSDGGQKGHDPNHGGEMASTGFHIHDTHFHVHFLHEKPS